MRIKWSKFSLQGEEETASRSALFIFREIMLGAAGLRKKIPAGGRGVVLQVHKFLGRPTHVDLRLPDGEYLLEVPIDYIKAEP
jgi:hypothetical protein